jgi:hypothetical protein
MTKKQCVYCALRIQFLNNILSITVHLNIIQVILMPPNADATAEVDSCWPVTAEARDRSQVSPVGSVVDKETH